MRLLFGRCVLDTDRRELTRESQPIAIGPQAFDLLVYLVQNRERVVTKDDLLDDIWNSRIVAPSTLTSHINTVRKAIGDDGDQQILIRTLARKGFRFVGEVRQEASPVALAQTSELDIRPFGGLALPDKPSIAVLPFQNMSGDAAQDYFADGVVEDIITALSRMRWLFVIARNSSFAFKGRSVDIKHVGRELGVRYVMEGSVRKEANRVRITCQLIDAASGVHLWADRFDGTLGDIFDLQDRLATSVVCAISPKLEQTEIDRAKRKPTDSLDAYDYYLRGMASFNQRSRDATADALQLFSRAIELDPEFGAAYGMAAWCYVWRQLNGWMIDRATENAEGVRLARRAIETGKEDAVALARGGHAFGYLARELDTGVSFVDRALQLNPNLACAWVLSGLLRTYRGEPDVAIEHLACGMRLSPLDPTMYHMRVGTGLAHLLARRFDDAVAWTDRALQEEPNYLPALAVAAASHAMAERIEAARVAMERLRRINPSLRISVFPGLFRRPEHFAIWAEGLRKAGLPE